MMALESWLLPLALVVAVKSSLLILASLWFARRLSALDVESRLWLWRSTIVALLILPWLSFGLPSLELTLPVAGSSPAVAVSPGIEGVPLSAAPGPVSLLPGAPVLAIGLFLAGVLAALAVWTRDALRLRRWRNEGRRASQPPVPGLYRDIERTLGLRRPVDVRWSKASPSPLSWGLRRPTILLPDDWRGAGRDALRAALAHELAHVRRSDWIWLLLARAASAFYWCNPLVAVVVRRLAEDTELACDRLALDCGCTRSGYARTLVRAASPASTAALGMAAPRLLERRIEHLLTPLPTGAPMNRNQRLCLGAGLLAVLLPLSACTLTQASEVEPAAPPSRIEAPAPEAAVMPALPPRVATEVSAVAPPAAPARAPHPGIEAPIAVVPSAPSAPSVEAPPAPEAWPAAEHERARALRAAERVALQAERARFRAQEDAERAERDAARAARRVERDAQRIERDALRAEALAARSQEREARLLSEKEMLAAEREALAAQEAARRAMDQQTRVLERELALSQERVEALERELEQLREALDEAHEGSR